ncbi:MAG: hypothetical protein MK193_02925 [Lentisphaeria bacterium]|nr:hypothetical protein [Lentisphaeria bacterium]
MMKRSLITLLFVGFSVFIYANDAASKDSKAKAKTKELSAEERSKAQKLLQEFEREKQFIMSNGVDLETRQRQLNKLNAKYDPLFEKYLGPEMFAKIKAARAQRQAQHNTLMQVLTKEQEQALMSLIMQRNQEFLS